MRRGAYVLPKYLNGKPIDETANAADHRGCRCRCSASSSTRLLERRRRRHDRLRPAEARPQAASRRTRPSPRSCCRGSATATSRSSPTSTASPAAATVRFADGSEEEIDLVVYCTGYKITFPFFDPEVFSAPDNRLPLYRRVVSVERPGLYFIGFIQPLGPIMPLAEAQCGMGRRPARRAARRYRRRRRCGERSRARKRRCESASSPLSVIRSRSTSIPTCARSGASESGLRSGPDDPGAARPGGQARQRRRGAAAVGPAARPARQLRPRPPALEAAVGVLGAPRARRRLARPPDEPDRAQDRDLQDDEQEEDRPEPRHRVSVAV